MHTFKNEAKKFPKIVSMGKLNSKEKFRMLLPSNNECFGASQNCGITSENKSIPNAMHASESSVKN